MKPVTPFPQLSSSEQIAWVVPYGNGKYATLSPSERQEVHAGDLSAMPSAWLVRLTRELFSSSYQNGTPTAVCGSQSAALSRRTDRYRKGGNREQEAPPEPLRKWSETPSPNPRYMGATPVNVARALLGKKLVTKATKRAIMSRQVHNPVGKR